MYITSSVRSQFDVHQHSKVNIFMIFCCGIENKLGELGVNCDCNCICKKLVRIISCGFIRRLGLNDK